MKRWFLLCLTIALLVGHIATSHAITYMQIPNIQGEVTEGNHAGWIEVQALSWSHNEAPPSSPVRMQFNRVIFTKTVDSVSAALALSAADGHPMKDVKVEILRGAPGGGGLFVAFRMKLTNARLTSYAASAQPGGAPPMESLALAFDTITWVNFKISASGQSSPGTAGCWDVVGNKSCAPAF